MNSPSLNAVHLRWCDNHLKTEKLPFLGQSLPFAIPLLLCWLPVWIQVLGYFNDDTAAIRSSQSEMQRYMSKISALLDRIDLQSKWIPYHLTSSTKETSESSAAIRARVTAAREVQRLRFKENPKVFHNAQMNTKALRKHCQLSDQSLACFKSHGKTQAIG